MNELAPHHRKMLEQESAIKPEIWQSRGVKSLLDPGDINELTQRGFSPRQVRHMARPPGLLLPVHTTDGMNGASVFRPDNPYVEEQKQKGRLPDGTYPNKVIKYVYPKGKEPRIDCPPVCQPNLKDPTIPIWVTEGQKKGDGLASQGLCAIDLPNGVWGWKSKTTGVLSDLDHIAWQDREVYIVFDSDVTTKKDVGQAMARLSTHISRQGGKVTIVPLPPGKDGEKLGVDDFFAQGGTVEELKHYAEMGKLLPIQTDESPQKKSRQFMVELDHLGYSFRMNATNDQLEVNSEPITDPVRATIRTQMRDLGYGRYLTAIQDSYLAYAYKNQYHPVRDYLNSLEWDGLPQVDTLATYFSDTDEIFRVWLKRWMIGSCAKVFEQAQNPMLVLDGPQDIGKSFFVSWLASGLPDLFIEGPINPDDKDNHIRLISKWVWEVAELGATTRKADREALKFFITQRSVTVRKPYDRDEMTKPALCSLIGTINNEAGFLNDPTGNRRFLTCELTGIDWSYTQLDVSQLWAEAMHLYREGEPWQLTKTEKAIQRVINARYRVEEPIADLVLKYYRIDPNNGQFIRTVDILQTLETYGLKGSQKANQMALASMLREFGLEKVRVEGERGYYGLILRPGY